MKNERPVTGGQIEFYDDGKTVIRLDTVALPRKDPPRVDSAPTACFRWAKSGPNGEPVLQQKWFFTGALDGWEWREVETVIVEPEPESRPSRWDRMSAGDRDALAMMGGAEAVTRAKAVYEEPLRCAVCGKGPVGSRCARTDCPSKAERTNLGPKCPSCGLRLDEAKEVGCLISSCAYYVRRDRPTARDE